MVKGRQASDRSPLKTAAGLMTQQRTGPRPSGAVPSLNKAATMAATPPAAHGWWQTQCDSRGQEGQELGVGAKGGMDMAVESRSAKHQVSRLGIDCLHNPTRGLMAVLDMTI